MKKKVFIIFIAFLILIAFILICIIFIDTDNFPLDMELNGEGEVNINIGSTYKDEGASARFLFIDVSNKIIVSDNIDTSIPGTYQVNYSYENLFVKNNIERKVVVVDNIPPTLSVEKEKVTIFVNNKIDVGKIKATDNIDGDISKNVTISELDTSKSGSYKLKISIKDSSGNETSKEVDVKIKKRPVKNGSNNARIDVYISEQKLYYFENDKLILTSDVVTGKKDGTPRGNYKIIKKKKDVYLKGDTFLDHVDYWMAFIGGLYGIHDAQWRSEFGGNIYKKNGSHGCVNMPIDNMKKLYERAEVGTAVNIYD